MTQVNSEIFIQSEMYLKVRKLLPWAFSRLSYIYANFFHRRAIGQNVHFWSIEHSENRNITYFENEVGPGVLQFNIQQIYNLQNFHTKRTK